SASEDTLDLEAIGEQLQSTAEIANARRKRNPNAPTAVVPPSVFFTPAYALGSASGGEQQRPVIAASTVAELDMKIGVHEHGSGTTQTSSDGSSPPRTGAQQNDAQTTEDQHGPRTMGVQLTSRATNHEDFEASGPAQWRKYDGTGSSSFYNNFYPSARGTGNPIGAEQDNSNNSYYSSSRKSGSGPWSSYYSNDWESWQAWRKNTFWKPKRRSSWSGVVDSGLTRGPQGPDGKTTTSKKHSTCPRSDWDSEDITSKATGCDTSNTTGEE
ncbi:unnamed protein product, partial [Amoebophrya sp. A25]